MKPGDCYRSSLAALAIEGSPRARLCHGIPTLTRAPFIPYGHAWIEVRRGPEVFCIDPSRPGILVERARYYRVGKIEPGKVRRYTMAEALRLADELGAFGPWDSEIEAAAHADSFAEAKAESGE